MKLFITIFSVALCESANIVQSGIIERGTNITTNYLEAGDIKNINKLKVCDGCFWLGNKDIQSSVKSGIKSVNDALNKKAEDEDSAFSISFKVNNNVVTTGLKRSPIEDTNSYVCEEDKLCAIKITWDGYSGFSSEDATDDNIVNVKSLLFKDNMIPWKYERKGNLLIITHRFTGKIKRTIVYTQLATVSKGSLSVQWWSPWHFDTQTKNIDFNKDPITITNSDMFDKAETKYYATVFGYEDQPVTE